MVVLTCQEDTYTKRLRLWPCLLVWPTMSNSNIYRVDDTDPHISREPPDAWHIESVSGSYNETVSYTITKNAQFRVNFSGE